MCVWFPICAEDVCVFFCWSLVLPFLQLGHRTEKVINRQSRNVKTASSVTRETGGFLIWFLSVKRKLLRVFGFIALEILFYLQPGAVKLVLWCHWMHLSYMHPVTSKNQFTAPGCALPIPMIKTFTVRFNSFFLLFMFLFFFLTRTTWRKLVWMQFSILYFVRTSWAPCAHSATITFFCILLPVVRQFKACSVLFFPSFLSCRFSRGAKIIVENKTIKPQL